MQEKENQRVVITKRMLLEALLGLLEKKHIGEVSVTELCAKAGINRATFYKHYGTPNDILAEVARRYTREMLLLQEKGDRRSIRQIIEDNCQLMHDNRKIICMLVKNSMERDTAVRVLMRLFEGADAPYIIDMSAFDEVERRLTITYIANGCYSLIEKWIMEEIDKTPHQIAELLYRICTRGWINDSRG